MKYDSLPADEQIRRLKPLPKWWYEIDKIPLGLSKDKLKIDDNISGMEAVYRCLSEAKISIPCREISRLTGYQETSVAKWLYQLMDKEKITYEEIKQRKFWHLLKAGEAIPQISIRLGTLRNRILKVLEKTPQEWISPLDLKSILNLDRTGTIIQSLHGLWRAGEIQRRHDPAIMTHPRRHSYQYRLDEKSTFGR